MCDSDTISFKRMNESINQNQTVCKGITDLYASG